MRTICFQIPDQPGFKAELDVASGNLNGTPPLGPGVYCWIVTQNLGDEALPKIEGPWPDDHRPIFFYVGESFDLANRIGEYQDAYKKHLEKSGGRLEPAVAWNEPWRAQSIGDTTDRLGGLMHELSHQSSPERATTGNPTSAGHQAARVDARIFVEAYDRRDFLGAAWTNPREVGLPLDGIKVEDRLDRLLAESLILRNAMRRFWLGVRSNKTRRVAVVDEALIEFPDENF